MYITGLHVHHVCRPVKSIDMDVIFNFHTGKMITAIFPKDANGKQTTFSSGDTRGFAIRFVLFFHSADDLVNKYKIY